VHPRHLAVAKDIAGIGAEEPSEADGKPCLVGISECPENLVEVGDPPNERHGADDQEQRDHGG
jgi:hypothetical protein